MSKPEDVPEDVWEAAAEPAHDAFNAAVDLYETGMETASVQLVIARAIMAERERCLNIANGWLIAFGEMGAELKFTTPQEFANGAVSDIADAINSGATFDRERA